MPIKKVRKLLLYIRSKKEEKNLVKKIIENNKEYLNSGLYKIEFSGKIKIYLEDKCSKKFLMKNNIRVLDSFSSILRYSIDNIFFKFLTFNVINKKDREVKGSLIMVTYSKNIKIFDFKKKLILNRLVNDSDTYYKIKHAYNNLGRYLKMTIIDFIDFENAYLEKYVDFIPYTEWGEKNKEKCIINIFDSYKKYFSIFNLTGIESRKSLNLLKDLKKTPYGNHRIFNEIENNLLDELEHMIIPVVRLHGDLKFDNILLYEEEFYFIDLEFSSEFIFFYDLFNYIFVTAIYDDHFYLEKYLDGDYDKMFKDIFEVLGLRYENDKKLFYISIYLIDRIYQDYTEVTVNGLKFENMLEKYYALFNKIELSPQLQTFVESIY